MNCKLKLAVTRLGVAMLVLGSELPAQTGRVELVPVLGSFAPLGAFATVKASSLESSFKQSYALGFGARVNVRPGQTLGVQASFLRTSSGWKEDAFAGGERTPGAYVPGHTTILDGALLITPRRSQASFAVGLAHMSRGGSAWDPALYGNTTAFNSNLALRLGIGARARISARAPFEVALDGYFHSRPIVAKGFSAAALQATGLMADVFVSIGVPITLARR